MDICIGCNVYNIAFGTGRVKEISDSKIVVNYSKKNFYNIDRTYSKKDKNKAIFVDKEDFTNFYRNNLLKIDPDALMSGTGLTPIRRINLNFELVNLLISKHSRTANIIARDILYILSFDTENISRICQATEKMSDSGDHATALNIAIELGLEDCFDKVLKTYLKSLDDLESKYPIIKNNIRAKNAFLLPHFNYVIDNLDCDKSFIQYRNEIVRKEKEEIREAARLERRKQFYIKEINNIKEVQSKRDIKYLVHFTNIKNLPSILEHGIVPPLLHEQMGITSIHSDDNTNYRSSISIEFPNYFMFKAKKLTTNSTWVLLLIDSSALTDLDLYLSQDYLFKNNSPFAYYSTNAKRAGGYYRVDSLDEMFSDEIMSHKTHLTISRSESRIPDCYTTDPQAEICASVTIPPKYIKKIIFSSDSAKEKYLLSNNISTNILIECQRNGEDLMGNRCDYAIWRERGGY